MMPQEPFWLSQDQTENRTQKLRLNGHSMAAMVPATILPVTEHLWINCIFTE